MLEPQQMRRFERTFFRFTRVEEHFLMVLQRLLGFLKARQSEAPRFLVCTRRRSSPQIEMSVSIGRSQQPVTLQIHGLKPVRYHFHTENTALGRKLRRYFSMVLGEANLVAQDSTQSGPNLSLVYHVHYPDEVVRHLSS